MPRFNLNWVYAIIIIPLAYLLLKGNSGNFSNFHKEVSYSTFKSYVENGYASKINVNKGEGIVTMYVKKESAGKIFGNANQADENANVTAEISSVDNLDNFITEQQKAKHFNGPVYYESGNSIFSSVLINLMLPILFFFGIYWLFFRRMSSGGAGGGVFSVGKSKAQIYDKENGVHVTFKDVAGQDEAKQEVQEVVKFLKNPRKYTELGGKIPKGILLVGPPGTGKTLLAKAVAGEANVPFFSISGSDFVEMFVGVGASRVRDLFEQAKKTVPCVIFIDEIDAVGRNRGSARFSGGNEEREQTLNQLLVEMDGFETNEGIILIAATNRSDILDPALVRPGRFDKSIFVGFPDVKGREEILRIHAKGKPFDKDVKLKDVAKATSGFTGADLENLLNESALLAARRNKKVISNQDVKDATLRVIIGTEKKSRVMTEEEKKITAYHESGHAIVTHFCKTQDAVHEISIIPRGHAGGYTLSLPEKNVMYASKTKLEESIATCLGGRIAEDIIFHDISTGASSDLEHATEIARKMVTQYGMSSLGPIVYEESSFEFGPKRYSEDLASKIDSEMKKIIQSNYSLAEKIIRDNIKALENVAKALLEKEKLDGDEFINILNAV